MRVVSPVAVFAVAMAGCGAGAHPACSQSEPCGTGEACVVGVCRAKNRAAVPEKSRRVVLLAEEVAILSASERIDKDAVVAPLGARAAGALTVLVRFDAKMTDAVEVVGAFIVMDPEPASPGPAASVEVEVFEVLGPWQLESVSWGRQPRTGLALATAEVPAARRAPLRIDVTEVVSRTRGLPHGVALTASGDDPVGARFVTGAGSSSGPRLELYLR